VEAPQVHLGRPADVEELAAESHRGARAALALAAPGGAEELERITDFIYTRPS